MFLPILTCVRGLTRRVKPLKELPMKTTLRKPRGRSTKVVNVVNSPKESISSGGSEIIIYPQQLNQPVHHATNMKTFESLNLRTDVINGLETMNIGKPTIIQLLGIPMVLEGQNVFCAAQTGSGKTLVYTVPIINMILDKFDNGYISRISRPSAIVVAPSRELAVQILKVFKSFYNTAPIRSLGLIGQKQKKWTRDYAKGLVDVIVATPDTLLKYHKRGLIIFSDLQYIVFDEADTLLDDNFKETTQNILNLCSFEENNIVSSKRPLQCILTAATLPPKGILNLYKTSIPRLEMCQSNLHKVLPNIKHTFIKTGQSKKLELLLNRLQLITQKNGEKCIVFCNTTKSCNWVSIQLSEKKIKHSRAHAKMDPKERFKDFEEFIGGENKLLVCTDIASRGMDITEVTLVINFDCPFNATDYIHRSGRTGRATEVYVGKGEVITFITKNKEVLFAQKVQSAAEKNECLGEILSKSSSSEIKYKKDLKNYSKTAKEVKERNYVKKIKENKSTKKIRERYALKMIKKKM